LPLHAQRCFAYLEHEPADFPESQRASEEVLALPIYPELRAEQLEYVVQEITAFFH
jgi:dTDP-4-amino-4,6-dideoxygalactose transaminase